MSFKITGKIERFLPIESGDSAKGEWKKQCFIVKTEDQYNNTYCFEMFKSGEHIGLVDNLSKYNKAGDNVNVEFNVNTNESKDKFFTSLKVWKVEKSQDQTNNSSDPLPF